MSRNHPDCDLQQTYDTLARCTPGSNNHLTTTNNPSCTTGHLDTRPPIKALLTKVKALPPKTPFKTFLLHSSSMTPTSTMTRSPRLTMSIIINSNTGGQQTTSSTSAISPVFMSSHGADFEYQHLDILSVVPLLWGWRNCAPPLAPLTRGPGLYPVPLRITHLRSRRCRDAAFVESPSLQDGRPG